MAKRPALSPAQSERQREEYRNKGKYAKVNPCYACGKSAGIDYYSHALTDTGNWDDAALCLCARCADETKDMTNVDDFYAYQKKKQTPKERDSGIQEKHQKDE
jgi:hypothetical protein